MHVFLSHLFFSTRICGCNKNTLTFLYACHTAISITVCRRRHRRRCPVSYRPAISVTLCRHRCRCPVSYHTKTCRRVDHTAISVTVCRHGCRCPVSYHTAISVTVCRHRRRCPVRITTETLTNHIYYIITTFIDLAI